MPCATLSPDDLRAELQAMQAGTKRPYNVNFFCHTPPVVDAARQQGWMDALAPYHQEFGIDPTSLPIGPGRVPFDLAAAALLVEFKPLVVSFHFGLPTPELLAAVKSWGATVMSTGTTLAEAQWLEAHGADVIIAQGLEAGGHRGMFLSEDLGTQINLRDLLKQILPAVRCPVIAAGGIRHAADVQEMLRMGAAAVQVGSAYLLCPESKASALHRAALQSPAAQHTVLTNVFTGHPARGMLNRFVREVGPMSDAVPAFPLATNGAAPLRAKAEAMGSDEFSPLWAGQNAWLAEPRGAAELTEWLAGAA